ncbi:hypothetical protein EV356DRAFT_537214 [Viridothelium virens]|uniref:Uncharacterized protein n=1 Tax=Viridothelium virens TaxID=1048519 RepID=A0A6A6GUY0_VIRVR|nr:hypothetical protein EV356DRAFT_537214 [Viridothelium virens]
MSLYIVTDNSFDFVKAAELYYNYLRAAGYFPDGSRFDRCVAKSDCCSCSICRSCINAGLDSLESGTLLIKESDSLCSAGKKDLRSILTGRKKLNFVLASKSTSSPQSLGDLLPFGLQQLSVRSRTENSEELFQLVKAAFLKIISDKFKGGMKFKGGPNGTYVRVAVRKIIDDRDK